MSDEEIERIKEIAKPKVGVAAGPPGHCRAGPVCHLLRLPGLVVWQGQKWGSDVDSQVWWLWMEVAAGPAPVRSGHSPGGGRVWVEFSDLDHTEP